jgi:hypothetical protein
MLTNPTVARPSRRGIALGLPLVLLIAACGSATAPSPTRPAETPRATPTAVPGGGGEPGATPGSGGGAVGGGAGGNTGSGVAVFPIPPLPGDNPLLGNATSVVPRPGRLDPHPVSVQLVRAAVGDDGVRVELRWWSGVEECYATDSVQVERDDPAKTIKLTVMEGSNGGDIACIDIAMLKTTVVDLGALGAGTWQISAEGDAPTIDVEID